MRYVLLVLVVVLGGCATGKVEPAADESAAIDSADLSTVEGFCDAYARASCSEPVRKACVVKTLETCIHARATACKANAPQGTTYVPDKAKTCVGIAKSAHTDA